MFRGGHPIGEDPELGLVDDPVRGGGVVDPGLPQDMRGALADNRRIRSTQRCWRFRGVVEAELVGQVAGLRGYPLDVLGGDAPQDGVQIHVGAAHRGVDRGDDLVERRVADDLRGEGGVVGPDPSDRLPEVGALPVGDQHRAGGAVHRGAGDIDGGVGDVVGAERGFHVPEDGVRFGTPPPGGPQVVHHQRE